MTKNSTRLIVSFVGKTDLDFLQPQGENLSPIRRVLRWLCEVQPYIPPARTRLLLFDDHPETGARARFCEDLNGQLPGLGLDGLSVERRPVVLPDGPTDLNALYEQVWAAIPTSAPEQADEIVFHLTSGTPAMQLTLMLAAHCLRLDKVRLIETSREQDVREVRPPYVLAARDRRLDERVRLKSQLTDKARRALLATDTVIDDPVVEAAYAALYKAATNRKLPQRLVVLGPVGSGKWHACRQFATWRRGDTALWFEPEFPPELPAGATLLIHRLDTWPRLALQRLTLLAAERPDCAIAATFRTDRTPVAPLEVLARDGLRGAAQIHLPALGARSDVVILGEALARQVGALGGKVKERLQYELLTDLYPHNLHDLKSLLSTAAARSPSAHPERAAYVQARQIRDTQALLAEAWQILSGMDFGPNRYRLDDVLDVVRAVIVSRALADGRSQEEAGDLLGISQQTVSAIGHKRLDLRGWRTALDEPD